MGKATGFSNIHGVVLLVLQALGTATAEDGNGLLVHDARRSTA